MFIGREKELKKLNLLIEQKNSSLVIVYGRRRIGKTEMIRHFCEKRIKIEFTGSRDANATDQRFNFLLVLDEFAKKQNKDFRVSPGTSNWTEAFAELRKCINMFDEKEKKVIFIDELPWFDTKNSGFLSALSFFWNNFCENRKDILLILCGSAASYMLNKIVWNTKTFHNRHSEKIYLEAFDLKETKKFLEKKKFKPSNKMLIETYIAFGGVAYYINKLNAGMTLDQNIQELCFDKNGFLIDEYDILFESLFENSVSHRKSMDILVKNWSGYTKKEISEKTKMSQTSIKDALIELEHSGFVYSTNKLKQSVRDIVYRSTDCFSFFYNKWMKNNIGKNWQNIMTKPAFNAWKGVAFENVCLLHIEKVKEKIGISGITTNNYYWKEDDVQIDILIEHEGRNFVDIIECKFYGNNSKLTKKDYNEFSRKVERFRQITNNKYGIRFVLITLEDIIRNEHFDDVVNKHITIKEILE